MPFVELQKKNEINKRKTHIIGTTYRCTHKHTRRKNEMDRMGIIQQPVEEDQMARLNHQLPPPPPPLGPKTNQKFIILKEKHGIRKKKGK